MPFAGRLWHLVHFAQLQSPALLEFLCWDLPVHVTVYMFLYSLACENVSDRGRFQPLLEKLLLGGSEVTLQKPCQSCENWTITSSIYPLEDHLYLHTFVHFALY